MGSGFSADQIVSQEGKVAIVTGANTGIGRVTALELARNGAHVILACRSADRTMPVVDDIVRTTNNQKVEFMELDLGSLQSVVNFVKAFRAKHLPLHLLINNAGVMATPYTLSADGIELQFATNHLGHFLLTTQLLDIIENSAPSRIVCLSSIAHKMSYKQGIRFDLINDEASYQSWNAYGQSKMCNILFANELNRRLSGKDVYVNSAHPGYVATDLQRHVADSYGKWLSRIGRCTDKIAARSPENGALTTLYLSTSPEVESLSIRGQYFVPTAKRSVAKRQARDQQLAERLWTFSEELIASKFSTEVEGEEESDEESGSA